MIQLIVWISKCHMCRKCQAIQGMAVWPSSAVEMGWAFHRVINRKVTKAYTDKNVDILNNS